MKRAVLDDTDYATVDKVGKYPPFPLAKEALIMDTENLTGDCMK